MKENREKICTPVKAFITFEEAEGYNLARTLTSKDSFF